MSTGKEARLAPSGTESLSAPSFAAAADVIIRARGLRRRYGSVDVLRGVDLVVRRGEIVALLGPNGAGKTTLVEILEGFREPSGGNVSVLGVDPAHAARGWRERVGIVLQKSRPEPGLSVRECLELYAGYYRAPRPLEETIALVGLEDRGDRQAEELSGGEQRRLDLALALIGDPELLFLDEPTTGLDPSARRIAWRTIEQLRALGKTIVLTTHYLDEAQRLADRIAVIVHGELVCAGTPATLGGRDAPAGVIRFGLPPGTGIEDLPAPLHGLLDSESGETVVLRSRRPLADVHDLAHWARARGFDLRDLEVRRPSLEDVYLQIIEDEEDRRCC
jgi:ABC-2 type transport system ATP-binding protein